MVPGRQPACVKREYLAQDFVLCWDRWRNRVLSRSSWLRFPDVHTYLGCRSSVHRYRADLVHLGRIDTAKGNFITGQEYKVLG